jgi:hypothetical protein
MNADDEKFEEGEVRVIDDENYVVADSLFEFKYDENATINWRNIS